MRKILVSIEFMSALKRGGFRQKAKYSFTEPITINQLLDFFGFTTSEKNYLMVIVNKNKHNSLEYSVKHGDEIFITLPIGGG